MQALQHLLIFVFQFTVISSIAVITTSFVNYVIDPNLNTSRTTHDGEFDLLPVSSSIAIESISENDKIVDEIADRSVNPIELLCISDELIDRSDSDTANIVEATDLTYIDLSKITLRQARKVAKQLRIKQKVNGKDQPKSWLIRQIEQKLKDDLSLEPIASEALTA